MYIKQNLRVYLEVCVDRDRLFRFSLLPSEPRRRGLDEREEERLPRLVVRR